MSKAVNVICLIVAFGWVPAAFAQDFTTAQVLEKLDEKAKAFSSLETSVSHAQVRDGLKFPTKPGKIFIKMAKGVPRFFWDVTDPKEPTKILIDKGELKVYNPLANSARVERISANNEMLQLLLIGFGVPSTTLNKNYKPEAKGRESLSGVSTVVLELTSISAQTTRYPKITLWLDPKTWTPIRTRVVERSGDYTDFNYSDVKLNKSVSDSKFNLKIPSNAKR
jgi:outer membrane lipoprotein-sorting protein